MKKKTKTFVISGRTHGMTVQAVSVIDATTQFVEQYPDEEIDLIQEQTADGSLSIVSQ